MSRLISLALQKGGVGKTTCAINLAGALAGHHGLNTLLLDFDGQTNATTTLLGRHHAARGDVWSVLYAGEPIERVMLQAPQHPRLFVVPGSPELAYWEKKLSEEQWDALVREGRRILRERIPDGIDVVIIDTPPSLGLWLQVAIAASDGVVLVVQPHEFSADGIRDLMRTVEAVQDKINPDLVIDGLIVNGVRPTTGEHAAWVDEYRRQFGAAVLEPPLLERIVVAEAQRLKTPLEFYAARGAAEARGWFRDIAGTLVERTNLRPSGRTPTFGDAALHDAAPDTAPPTGAAAGSPAADASAAPAPAPTPPAAPRSAPRRAPRPAPGVRA
jgi:chromosome partitioning protein